jgi:hypothetical protein
MLAAQAGSSEIDRTRMDVLRGTATVGMHVLALAAALALGCAVRDVEGAASVARSGALQDAQAALEHLR